MNFSKIAEPKSPGTKEKALIPSSRTRAFLNLILELL
jgi:hypothetical protein